MTEEVDTLGQARVRIQFNPGKSDDVYLLKSKAAELIDFCDLLRRDRNGGSEEQRLWALAMTHIEDAAMWAVKAVTSWR